MKKKWVKENMSTHLITVGWNEKMETAFKRMQSKKVRHLPVTNEEGEIIGMLSDRDIQRSMISQIEHPSGHLAADEKIEFDEDCRVRDYMSWPIKSVDQDSNIRLVAERMVLEKVSSLLVCHGEKIMGVVTTEDLLKVLIQVLSDPKAPKQWTLKQILDEASEDLRATLV
jgi:CBS domain-containing protein